MTEDAPRHRLSYDPSLLSAHAVPIDESQEWTRGALQLLHSVNEAVELYIKAYLQISGASIADVVLVMMQVVEDGHCTTRYWLERKEKGKE